jgi:hypothetical protein
VVIWLIGFCFYKNLISQLWLGRAKAMGMQTTLPD